MSLGTALGIQFYCGIPFTQLTPMAAFICLGVGVDDMFIIVDAFTTGRRSMSRRDSLAHALASCGPSITFTSATDFVAFIIGLTMELRAVQYFAVTSAIAILAIFFYQLTFFVSCHP